MSAEHWVATEAEEIVESYIKYHHDLIGAVIGCVFKEKASKSDGQPIVCKVSKVSPKVKPYMEEPLDYLIEVGADAWQELTQAQKEANIDHILAHCYGEENETTGEMKWKTRRPEIEAFPDVINRHGIHWAPGLPKIETLKIFKQPQTVEPKTRDEVEDPDFDDLTSDLN
jgi:hypothetical protein